MIGGFAKSNSCQTKVKLHEIDVEFRLCLGYGGVMTMTMGKDKQYVLGILANCDCV